MVSRWLLLVVAAMATVFQPTHQTEPTINRIRNTLLHANPSISAAGRKYPNAPNPMEHESCVRPLEPAIRAVRFWKHVGPVLLHYKFTEAWFRFIKVDSDPEFRAKIWDSLHAKYAPSSLECILDLRGLFVKIGQVMSSRADFVPRQYVDCFHGLQDSVPAWEKERVESILRNSLEIQGLSYEEVFDSLGEVLGSASIGQVHIAKLTPKFGGRDVAVKVMHYNAERKFRSDFKLFRTLCKVALPGWDPILRELEMQMMTEFDYNNEALNLQTVRNNMLKSPYANKVRVPEPLLDLCSKNVLVMEYLSGKKLAVAIEEKLTSILGGDVIKARKILKAKQQSLFDSNNVGKEKDLGFFQTVNNIIDDQGDMATAKKATKALQLMSMTKDARKKLSLLLDVTGHQIFHDGIYNGDPHPGNILVLDCGRLGLIDYGQTRRLTCHDRLALAGVVAELGKHHSDVPQISNAMREFGFRSKFSNDDIMAKNAALFFDSDAAGKHMGYATPQKYLQYLNSIDPMIDVPDAAVFVARTSFLFRGLGALLQQQIHTSSHWRKHAQITLDTDGKGRQLYNLGLTPIVDD